MKHVFICESCFTKLGEPNDPSLFHTVRHSSDTSLNTGNLYPKNRYKDWKNPINLCFVWYLTFLCSWGRWAPTLIPRDWFVAAISLFRTAFVSGCRVHRNAPPCLHEAAQHRQYRGRRVDCSMKAQFRQRWHCSVCVDKHANLCEFARLHGVLSRCLLKTPVQSFQYLPVSHDCVLCGLALNSYVATMSN